MIVIKSSNSFILNLISEIFKICLIIFFPNHQPINMPNIYAREYHLIITNPKSIKIAQKSSLKRHQNFDHFLHWFFIDFGSVLGAKWEPCWPPRRPQDAPGRRQDAPGASGGGQDTPRGPKRPQDASRIDFLWIFDGFLIDFLWFFDGFLIDFLWIFGWFFINFWLYFLMYFGSIFHSRINF